MQNDRKSHLRRKVFVSGCYDMLHSGHVAFFKAASAFGDLYVGIGSDATIYDLKKRKTVYGERERLYMVKAIRYVTDAFINPGSGMMDFVETIDRVQPDIFVVNTDGGSDMKRKFCEERGIEYIELQRIPDDGLDARSTTSLRSANRCGLPYRLDLAGTWIDQPYVSCHHPGWALTISLEPTIEFMERGGMSTSTRNAARKIWPYELPTGNEEMLARLLFCFENDPEQDKGHISGAQDSIGICMSGLNRHYYDNTYWPTKIESCHDEATLDWLEKHLCLVPTFPRKHGCSVVTGKEITPEKVAALADAANRCWEAIMRHDLDAFAKSYADSFEAQVSMFPAMIADGLQPFIDKYSKLSLAHKLSGAGGGGYLALVIDGDLPEGAIPLKIRRRE
ncbi:MAG: adenylyltransferase/cytidyltransferase family protein [Muribaculaceae bacterium]|nr:adenylyltransferase/cytidyltransferase family protein [Muribaculaceae bacterium]